jgi:hypothetical protein
MDRLYLMRLVAPLAMLGLLAGCSPAPQKQQSASVPYDTSLPLKEFMAHAMQYAGDGIWKQQGTLRDATGDHSLFPQNAAQWEEAESASLALKEMTNVLLIPGRRIDEPQWDQAVLGVRAVAERAAKAAERHDKDAFFKAGGDLDEACEACHKRYDPTVAKVR